MAKKKSAIRAWYERIAYGPRFYVAHRYDAARNNPADKGSYSDADSLSADASMSAEKRKISRQRARACVANNAYAAGAANAIVTAVCGVPPRLQLTSPDGSVSSETLGQIEADFAVWSEAVNFPEKLRTMRYARFVDGEAFAVLFTNPTLELESNVTLDVRNFDASRVTSPVRGASDENVVDGIYFDDYGTPTKYRVLNYNPGDTNYVAVIDDASFYPAVNVCHWFKRTFPEQHRGFSELAPAIELFKLIDRYSKAVVQASETAADLAMVFTTDAAEDLGGYNIDENPEEAESKNPCAEISWSRGMTITAPAGWDAKQVNAEQPTSTYSMLVNEILSQIGSAIGVPKLLMKNSAENYNYSSARVDLQQFQNFVALDRQTLMHDVLYPVWRAWQLEYWAAHSIKGSVKAHWYFGGFFHVDPLKEANAQTTRLAANLTSLADEYGSRGKDWENELRQIAREKAYKKELEAEYGVTFDDYAPSGSPRSNGAGTDDVDNS